MESSSSSAPINSSQAKVSTETEVEATLKRNSNDIGWEYGILINPHNPDKVQCKLCGKNISAGVHIIKEHIARIPGNVSAYPKSSADDQAKRKNALNEAKYKKRRQKKYEHALMGSVDVDKDSTPTEEEFTTLSESLGSTKPPRSLGPMDKFATNINPIDSLNAAKTMREQNIKDAIWKEKSNAVKDYLADWIYEAGIPFNAIELDSFSVTTVNKISELK